MSSRIKPKNQTNVVNLEKKNEKMAKNTKKSEIFKKTKNV